MRPKFSDQLKNASKAVYIGLLLGLPDDVSAAGLVDELIAAARAEERRFLQDENRMLPEGWHVESAADFHQEWEAHTAKGVSYHGSVTDAIAAAERESQ